MKEIRLGSLFDGSGGFPLAGAMNGVTPAWASEVEPYPIRVTKERFPQMKHLGSVTEINGAEIEPVDVITFGSPCQGLSVAGLQKGVHDDYRSVLFFEAIRIIKEMRAHDRAIGRANEHIRPRFAVWENVPGAYSSNGGRDFQAVLQAICEIADPAVSIPFPQKGKWANAGCIVGDGYSIAWRTYDAQYWAGTPKRRKRIYLIADFGSERAAEILFELESLSGDHQTGEKAWQGIAADAARSAGGSDQAGGVIGAFMGGQGAKAHGIAYCDDGTTPTLKATNSGSNQTPDVVYQNTGIGWWNESKTAETLRTPCGGDSTKANLAVFSIEGVTKSNMPNRKRIVRRLTPLECNRLQGFPDGWGCVQEIKELTDDEHAFWLNVRNTHAAINGKKQGNYTKDQMIKWLNGLHTDSAEYKMWGNGIALPCARDAIRRIAEAIREERNGEAD